MKSQAILRLCYSTLYQVNIFDYRGFITIRFAFIFLQSRRCISLHEYQSKKILNENNLNVQRFQVVDNPKDAQRAGEELSSSF